MTAQMGKLHPSLHKAAAIRHNHMLDSPLTVTVTDSVITLLLLGRVDRGEPQPFPHQGPKSKKILSKLTVVTI